MGYPPNYGPFVPGQSPPQFVLSACRMLTEEGPEVVVGRQRMVYGTERATDPRLRAIAADFLAGIQIEVSDAQGRSLAGPSWVSDFPPHSRPTSALCADLNGDGFLDFVLPLASRGNGLGAEAHDLVVALSSGSKYRIWVAPTMAPSLEDFLALTGPGHCVIVKTTFASNEEARESKRHSYWVYNLLAVRDDELVVANTLDRRFPKWVWFTTGPNHKAAGLSSAEKVRIWKLQRDPMLWEAQPGRQR